MKTGIIIQCHDKSTRLPNKLFKELGDITILESVIATCSMSIADVVVLATSVDIENDTIVKWYEEHSYRYPKLKLYRFFGEDNNVLGRFYSCAKEHRIDSICRITSDCPLHTHHIINLCIKLHKLNNNDYTSFDSCDGLDTEVFSFKVLEEAYNNATEQYQLEHVTPYIKEKSSLKKQRLEDVKISLDTQEDFEHISKIYNS